MTRLALVTGASSGIGRAFAERLAADGFELVVVARRADRLAELAHELEVAVQVVEADLATDEGIEAVVDVCETRPLALLVNNAGVAHYKPLAHLTPSEARELVTVKMLAPTLLARAALPGMTARGEGAIINVAGMLAFSGTAPAAAPAGQRAVYVGALAAAVATSQTLSNELEGTGVHVHVVCPGIVATEFHEVQGMDLSALPRMSADDVVTAALAGIALGETVIAPGVEDGSLLEDSFAAHLAAFNAQRSQLAARYTPTSARRKCR